MTKRRTKLEWQVTSSEETGREVYFFSITKKGLKEALEQLNEFWIEYSEIIRGGNFESDEDFDAMISAGPRIELYEQDQIKDDFGHWGQTFSCYYSPEYGGMPKKAQRIWDNR
tara:strand:+ start:62 stop:400 length:339 start_codon:yes stop_codon:yes gene_type:complete